MDLLVYDAGLETPITIHGQDLTPQVLEEAVRALDNVNKRDISLTLDVDRRTPEGEPDIGASLVIFGGNAGRVTVYYSNNKKTKETSIAATLLDMSQYVPPGSLALATSSGVVFDTPYRETVPIQTAIDLLLTFFEHDGMIPQEYVWKRGEDMFHF